ncbi:MAG: SMC-Scp complex subunit ScpB [Nitrospinae bacterium]|nr:SMC-Scp complex subunit ScpB [Nitrospinota bacterium]MCH7768836.1 SMC-Scp complex subunit ScpB [Nitrospinota bacterium]
MELNKQIIEALLFAADQPITLAQMAELGPEDVEKASLRVMLEELAEDYDGRGVQLKEVAGGWQLSTRPEYGEWVRRMHHVESRAKLSRAALDTLAIVVYRQPITKTEVEALRGVDSSGVLKTLLERRLIKILGRKRVVGRPILYGSSREFLQYFGLSDLTDLPRPEDLDMPPEAAPADEQGDLLAALEAPGEAQVVGDGAFDHEEGATLEA